MKSMLSVLGLAASAAGAQTPREPSGRGKDAARPATEPAAGSAQGASAPSAEVVLFSATWCAYCRQARAYLARARIRYRDVDIDTPEGKAAYAAAGGGGVPLLVAKGEKLQGFTELAYDYFFARLE